jgi:hypothetical protein
MVLRIRRIGGRRDVLAVVPVGELGGPRCGRKRQRRHNNVCIVVPEWNMVVTRTNGGRKDGAANRPPNVDDIWSDYGTACSDV